MLSLRRLTCILLLSIAASSAVFGEDISLGIRVFPQNAIVTQSGRALSRQGWGGRSGYFALYRADNQSSVSLEADGYISQDVDISNLQPNSEGRYYLEIKLERSPTSTLMTRIATLGSGDQPKSIIFTADGRRMFSAMLNGPGIDVYDLDISGTGVIQHREIPLTPDGSRNFGYVEFAIDEQRRRLWVSQMTTGQVHVLDVDTLQHIASFSSHGTWTKVVCFDRSGNYVFVSNWLTEDISVFRADDFTFLGTFVVGGIPRGLAVSADNSTLYVADYENGRLLRYDISGLVSENTSESLGVGPAVTMNPGPGAQRHIVISDATSSLYVSDMMYGRIDKYSLETGRLEQSRIIAPKLNTIAIDPTGSFLYVSSRGRNNPETYLIPGPDFGKVFVLDARSLEIIDWTWGTNQPTGLALSPDGTVLAFSDFLDARIELYDVSVYSAVNPLVRSLARYRNALLEGLYRRDKLPTSIEFVEEQPETGATR